MTKFILFMNLDMVDRNSAPEEFACIWQSKRVGIITIETEKMWIPFSMRRFCGCQPSWYLLKFPNIYASVNTCCKQKQKCPPWGGGGIDIFGNHTILRYFPGGMACAQVRHIALVVAWKRPHCHSTLESLLTGYQGEEDIAIYRI